MRKLWLITWLLLAPGCQDPELTAPTCPPPAPRPTCPGLVTIEGWCWQNPTPALAWPRAVWCDGQGGMVVVGDNGDLVFRAGCGGWNQTLFWSSPMYALWGTGTNSLVAVGRYGGATTFDGKNWSIYATSTSVTLRGVWGTGPADVYAVGHGGTITHFDGKQWKTQPSGTTEDLNGVWAASHNLVVAVGDKGTLIRNDGGGWRRWSNIGAQNLVAVWGRGPADIFVAGARGFISHFDGKNWTQEKSNTTSVFRQLRGVSPGLTLATSDEGVHQRVDRQWRLVYAPPDKDNWMSTSFTGICGNSATDVFAVGLGWRVVHFDGKTWTPMSRNADPHNGYLVDLWGASPTLAFAVGRQAILIKKEPNRSVYGGFGVILRWDGVAWREEQKGLSVPVRAVMGRSASEVYAVGGYSGMRPALVLKYDGKAWTTIKTIPRVDLGGLWVGDRDLHTVGYDYSSKRGVVYHFDGTNWTFSSPTSAHLSGIWGASSSAMFVVGSAGTIIRSGAGSWHDVASGTTTNLVDIWGTSASNVYAVGVGKTVSVVTRYDGNKWKILTGAYDETFSGIWGAGPTEIYVSSTRYISSRSTLVVHRYDGKDWHMAVQLEGQHLFGMGGLGPGKAIALGGGGTILHSPGW